ncbi:VWA domain-containing protein [Herbidospora galbida]|uniref:VWA domain-containing protein n=1 Tax=Herbidospora galbida TaxID=2575442 RepID=A0A4U3M7I4_9ACTN|nr:VWA domain-containing protein [Herbidospora galbida]TKK84801.1 VWA domain-containing protein [Herbidospora galbida]
MSDVVPLMVGFVRTLRAAGVAADHERTRGFLTALENLDAGDRKDVYWAGRLTLCAGPDDLPRYDRCFAAYFDGRESPRPATPGVTVARYVASPDGGPEEGGEQTTAATASTLEVLRSRDVAGLTPGERAEINRLLSLMRTARETRLSRRLAASKRGSLDPRRIVREAVKRGGEPARLRFRDRRRKPRRVVLLIDVSGSMKAYADTLLRLAHAVVRSAPRATEVFSAGTRLTRLTAELRVRDAARAMDQVSAAIPDWSGGTRLGEELRAFLRLPDARGAIVVIASDGWERGDPSLLGAQMERLGRMAHRVIWVNPHKGDPAYRPLTGGMRAALPHVDDLVAGHSLAAYEELAGLLAGRRAGHA